MSKNWTGNSKSVYSPLGSSRHSEKVRAKEDFYAIDPKVIDDLFEIEDFSNRIWEPAVGCGHLAEKIKSYGKEVYSTDKIDRGYGDEFFDFLKISKTDFFNGDVITNPPYRYAKEFVEKSLDVIVNGKKVAMFLKLTFLESQKRYKMFKKYPPVRVWVYSKRQRVARNGDPEEFTKSSAVCYAWFIWEKGSYDRKPVLDWIY